MKCKDCNYCASDGWCCVLFYLIHEVLDKPITSDSIAYRDFDDAYCEILSLLND